MRMQWIFVIFCVVKALNLRTAYAAEHETDYCGPPEVTFAHCPGHKPVFKSVALTEQGWNGSCESTFGSDDRDGFGFLYSLFKDKR